ncbi:hypothetical protein QF041_005568 [Paenibacillus sp. W2I17]|nr:hypothetical protein [Paenibacillus sp. W2I17]
MRQKPMPRSQGYTSSCLEHFYAVHLLVHFNLNQMTSCNLFSYIPNFFCQDRYKCCQSMALVFISYILKAIAN